MIDDGQWRAARAVCPIWPGAAAINSRPVSTGACLPGRQTYTPMDIRFPGRRSAREDRRTPFEERTRGTPSAAPRVGFRHQSGSSSLKHAAVMGQTRSSVVALGIPLSSQARAFKPSPADVARAANRTPSNPPLSSPPRTERETSLPATGFPSTY